jgi:S-adenosylmethionine:tRNA ribosyltransferase-isomerase
MRVEEFDFDLPQDLIAQTPLQERSASRLLVLNRTDGHWVDDEFRSLTTWLRPGDLLVFNDTKVMKARLHGMKESGGRLEILVERVTGDRKALAQIRASHKPRVGSIIQIGDGGAVTVDGRDGEFFRLTFPMPVEAFLDRHGEVPLPPYIVRAPGGEDETRYQTVYASAPGAVAAPTAGLHFDEAMLRSLDGMGVQRARLTLHVGAGTFQPVRVTDVSLHQMHSERYEIPAVTAQAVMDAVRDGRRVIAVGTTSLRALESWALSGAPGAHCGETSLFILPGFEFRLVDALLTNFHLPRSTLLMLVSAFAGPEQIRQAYAHAVAGRYRFFSYGDAMFIHRTGRGDRGALS